MTAQVSSSVAATSSLLPCFFGISTYAVLNWRYPSGFKVSKRSRMICFRLVCWAVPADRGVGQPNPAPKRFPRRPQLHCGIGDHAGFRHSQIIPQTILNKPDNPLPKNFYIVPWHAKSSHKNLGTKPGMLQRRILAVRGNLVRY